MPEPSEIVGAASAYWQKKLYVVMSQLVSALSDGNVPVSVEPFEELVQVQEYVDPDGAPLRAVEETYVGGELIKRVTTEYLPPIEETP